MDPHEYDTKSNENYNIIKEDLRKLSDFLNPFGYEPKKFWAYVKVVNSNFKTLKPLRKEDRQNLWNDFQSLFETERLRAEHRNDVFKSKSSELSGEILDNIKQANLWVDEDLKKSNNYLSKSMDLLKGAKLTKDDRNCCWEKWKETKDAITLKRKDTMKLNYRIIKGKIEDVSSTAVYGNPKEALDEIKKIQGTLRNYPMEDVYWNEVKNRLAHWWNEAKSRLDEHYQAKRENWEAKNREYHQRKERWKQNQEDFIIKLEGFYDNNLEYIERVRGQIIDLEDKINNAYSDDYRDRFQGWIDEKEDKIRDVQNKNEDLLSKIEEVKRSLDE